MPTAMLNGTMPHRAVTTENPERVVPLAPRVVEYLCGQCELITTARLHTQAPIPQLWPCRRCRTGAECTIEPDESAELIGVLAASKVPPRKSHWDHLRERRTDAELEALLTKRLDLLRSGRLHAGPTRS
ncbi:RNA polymerase-binding protein RbpA [Brachybacterium vulturis]|nr:RNA polymerase-binding protein RbpA [Brachybacterium vulturis]